ncbi:MAG: molybdopterin-dependent oxidoreductase [Chloroflexi bacterium]|nr:molybdopterin-dependent oxidoreductase [Chloroflexota bacterium]
MKEYSVVGKRLPRIDSPAKAMGQAKYAADLVLPRMLHGKVLRSPHPHARILNIDTSQAEGLPGVKAVVTGKDTKGVKFGGWRAFTQLIDQYPLCMDKVRYIGDEVAAVAAVDEDTAEEALDLIRVDYEPLQAILDPEAAMKEGAPRIHEEVERNICWSRFIEFGNVEEGFARSDYVREDNFSLQTQAYAPTEPRACLASFDHAGRLTIWTSTQCPYPVQCQLAAALGLREGDVRVVQPFLGGGFGAKFELFPYEVCCSLLAQKTGRPVKMMYTRQEEFSASRTRHAMKIWLKTGFKKDGTLMARQARAVLDGGAYTSFGPTVTFTAGFFHTLLYRLPNYKYEGYRVFTNKPPSSGMRGIGAVQPFFAGETQMDMVARDLGIDPIELRLKNARQPNEVIPKLTTVNSCGLSECLTKVGESTRWHERQSKLPPGRGIGIACAGQQSGGAFNWFRTRLAFSNARVRANDDGTVVLFAGAADIGQGSSTVLCQILAEELGVRFEDVSIVAADTGTTPVDIGTWGSRVTFQAGNAVRAAAIELKKQLFAVVAPKLNADPVDLDIKDRKIFAKGRPEPSMPFPEAVTAAQAANKGKILEVAGSYHPEGKGIVSPAYSFVAVVAEVEVDRETGQVKVDRLTVAHDCGQPINPMSVEGQVEGSVHMGLGYALTEQVVSEKGEMLNPSFLDYRIPTALDMPEVKIIEVITDEPEGPFGAKEAGEGCVAPVAPAIANAIYDAIGVRVKDLPITPEKVLKALREAQPNS